MKRIVSYMVKDMKGWERLASTRFKPDSHYPEISFQDGEAVIKYTKKENLILKQCLHRFIDTEEKIVESPTTDTDKKAFKHFKSKNPHSFFINPSLLQESDTSIESSNNPPINAAGNK
ncbi:hypothetical protein [Legionella sainthelensi]|uniref:Uncharacterized protein n=1 Tax=Legionella sainthelensi TaxID=28087 RepID=A0A2H5FGD6_9GAMM|nr:hypothetical protein [Legionella sainthelensi]AUH70614.1 hypothetical protein CAB17_00025 [Legionella sainthelensi]